MPVGTPKKQRFTVIAYNKSLSKEQWRGSMDKLSDAFDCAYKLATSDEWSKETTKSTIVFIIYDNYLSREADRYENK